MICISPQTEFGEERISIIDCPVRVPAIFGFVIFRQRTKAVLLNPGRRIGLI